MITALIIWILNTISADFERIANILPERTAIETIEALERLDVYSYFDTLGKLNKSIFWIILGIEAGIEFTLFLKFLPSYLSKKFERLRNRSIYEAEKMKAIMWKLENGVILTKKEEKFYNRKVAKKEK